MPEGVESVLTAGAEALQRGDWAAARDSFEAAQRLTPTCDALLGLGDAWWWLGDLDESLRCREQAYAVARRNELHQQAALAALLLCLDYRKQVGNAVASAAWLARMEELVTEHGLDELRGWLLFAQSFDSDDLTSAERWAEEARTLARESGDADLELCALSQLGAVLVEQGRVAEGVRRLDEAMTGSLAGEGRSPDTVVFTSCMMMTSCTRCAEFERAVQWVRSTVRFTEQYGCPFLYAECRTLYGGVLLGTGEWHKAEEELLAAVEMTRGTVPALFRLAVATLAQLRVLQGRVEEAERLVAGFDDLDETVAVLARIHLVRGRASVAAATLNRRLHAVAEQSLESSFLIELLGEAALALGDAGAAVEHGAALVASGERGGSAQTRARGERLHGQGLAALGDIAAARAHLDTALVMFARLEMRYETAYTRLLLAELLATTEPEVATAEARAALSVFEELGAGAAADRAAAVLRRLGVKAGRAGPRGSAELTRRETEILAMLGAGLSNPEIAARLHLSRKTVEHHVASVLSKLGLRSRAEAAAEAVRRQAAGPARR